jgi:hypothetical protein
MSALPLMLEEAQFAADFMELYLSPESADAPRLAAPGSPVNRVLDLPAKSDALKS